MEKNLNLHTNINSSWITDQNVKFKTIKVRRKHKTNVFEDTESNNWERKKIINETS